MTDKARLEQLFSRQQFMVLAVTLDDGTPWTVPVKLQKHEKNVFEWDSRLDTEHSKAIVGRTTIAVTVFEKAGDTQFGLYCKGNAQLIEETKPGLGRYRLTVDQAWVNDETFVKRTIDVS